MKHYAPTICLPLKHNLETRCQSRKRGIIQSNIYRNLPKVNQVIEHNLCAEYHDPCASGSPDILLTRVYRFTMH